MDAARELALRLAVADGPASKEQVIARAEAYLGFLSRRACASESAQMVAAEQIREAQKAQSPQWRR